MNYLILGCNSFAGASFIKHLLDKEQRVIGISRSLQSPSELLSYAQHRALSNFVFHQLDINQQSDALIALIKQKKPNVIVDFAGQGMVAESWQNPEQWYQTNIVAKVKLHNFLRQCDFLERYIRISTPEVYGHTQDDVQENTPFFPSTPYAVSHAAVDMSLLAFYRQYQFPVILTRFSNFYGPYQQLYRIIPRTILYALIGKRLPLHGGGTSKRAFIHGQDVASGLDAVIQRGKCGETYHFSAGDVIPIANLVRQICELLSINFENFVEISSDRPGKDTQYFMNTQKAEEELDWHPKINLKEGLSDTIAWVHRHFDSLKTFPLQYVHKV